MRSYSLPISRKTRILNLGRHVFRLRPVEAALQKRVRGLTAQSLWGRMVPPNYLYPKGSWRSATRAGSRLRLDISDVVDHGVFFDMHEAGAQALLDLAKPGMSVLDIGTNIGTTLLQLARRVGKDGSVQGFEPDPANFAKASRNLKLNAWADHARVANVGLGSENSVLKMFQVNPKNRGMNRILPAAQTEGRDFPAIEVKVRVLDEFLEEAGITRVDLVKIDTEGFEMNVLRGASKLLGEMRPVLFIELDDLNLRDQSFSASELVTLLQSHNYTVRRADDGTDVSPNDDFAKCHFDIIATPDAP
jgi:FkbM family methyltransferase